ncbi:thialysine N-epsilon-acetyltransferase isoform X1 [Protopterus annectens]|uniref:thialysine N-epsilon-acetyltransferase isoform X1 n=1 Tax=Protopterus annectens TaxID=7888 RepID=UPI001CFA988A|nr:thialysine N-epsilon-acetyltransferase isoform X1 [Protopterus annectens]
MDYIIRDAKPEDCVEIMRLITELAEYEKLPEQVQLDAESLREDGFGTTNPFYKCLVAELTSGHKTKEGHTLVAYAMYYFTYSTWLGRSIYVEDIYVMPECRAKGIGHGLLQKIAKIAVEQKCKYLQLVVLDWNKLATEFYIRRGCTDLTTKEGWSLFRFELDALNKLAEGDDRN